VDNCSDDGAVRQWANSLRVLMLLQHIADGRLFAGPDFMTQDFRHALRSLARSPGFAGIAILTLGIGIGLNTAVFSIINVMLFKR
jgi:hypothetical protein